MNTKATAKVIEAKRAKSEPIPAEGLPKGAYTLTRGRYWDVDSLDAPVIAKDHQLLTRWWFKEKDQHASLPLMQH
jgi:hypothetical protein